MTRSYSFHFNHSRINLSHSTQLVVFNRLPDLIVGVHYKWSIARDWLIQGHAGDEQDLERSFRLRRIFDSYFSSVLAKHNHLPVPRRLTLCTEQTLALDKVSERLISVWNLLSDHAAGLDPVMQVDDRCAGFNDGFLAHRFAGDHADRHQTIKRSRLWNLRIRDLLVTRFHHLVALWQIHPKLESVHTASRAPELTAGHL